MSLCTNRADGGQGTFKGDLTTCTEDSFIVPLPALVLCIGFIVCFAVRRHYPGENYDNDEIVGMNTLKRGFTGRIGGKFSASNKETSTTSAKGARSGINIGMSTLFVLLMAALFALHVLEMSRLSAGQLGIGILPLVTIGLGLATISMIIPTYATNAQRRRARPHFYPWALAMVVFLGGMAVVLGVKIHTLYRTETLLGAAKVNKMISKNPFSYGLRKLLNIVMCGIYIISFFLYIFINILDRKDAQRH